MACKKYGESAFEKIHSFSIMLWAIKNLLLHAKSFYYSLRLKTNFFISLYEANCPCFRHGSRQYVVNNNKTDKNLAKHKEYNDDIDGDNNKTKSRWTKKETA